MDDRNEWIRFSKDDLNSAKHLRSLHPVPAEIICFHCQQCAEKALKALFAKEGMEIFKTHDLLKLCDLLSDKYNFDSILSYCARLTNFAVITRYPVLNKLDLDDTHINDYIFQAESILNLILEYI